MTLRLVSRLKKNNMLCQICPPVLNGSTTKYNNSIVSVIFGTERELFVWLEQYTANVRKSTKITSKTPFVDNEYAVYLCTHDDKSHDNTIDLHDELLYTLRTRLPHEAPQYYIAPNNRKYQSIFIKKIYNKIPDLAKSVSFSTRLLHDDIYYESYDVQLIETTHPSYITYISSIVKSKKELSTPEFSCDVAITTWLNLLAIKLRQIQSAITFDIDPILYDPMRTNMIDNIVSFIQTQLSQTSESTSPSDIDGFRRLRSLISYKKNATTNSFQLKYDGEYINWHSDYASIIETYHVIPSRKFVNMIINFSIEKLEDPSSISDLIVITKNIGDMYGIECLHNF